jgi:uncharacterized protein (DUF2236 family)
VSTQPEALRLADALMEPVVLDKHMMQAAAELRRLHAVNAELVKALKGLLNSDVWERRDACAAARAAIARAEEVKP